MLELMRIEKPVFDVTGTQRGEQIGIDDTDFGIIDGGAGYDALYFATDQIVDYHNIEHNLYDAWDPSSISWTMSTSLSSYSVVNFEFFGEISADGSTVRRIMLFGDASDNDMTPSGDYGDILIFAGAGNDTVHGGSYGNFNHLYGGSGDDTFFAGTGAGAYTIFEGGRGADVFHGGAQSEEISYEHSQYGVEVVLLDNLFLYGDAEGDSLTGDIENLNGSYHDDVLGGTNRDNGLVGLDGDDALFGYDGQDRLIGGIGADYLDGGADTDTAEYLYSSASVNVNLGAGTASGGEAQGDILVNIENLSGSQYDDVLVGDSGANYIYGNAGNDIIAGGDGFDYLYGGDGNDLIYGGNGVGWIEGMNGDDILIGANEGDLIKGGNGDDTIYAKGGEDIVFGGNGRDFIVSGDGNDVLYGDAGDDTIVGGNGDDKIYGSIGNDLIYGGAGQDRIEGGDGNDIIAGGLGNDYILGGDGNDIIYAGGNTFISAHVEQIYGGDGDDILISNGGEFTVLGGGSGNDRLYGSDGVTFMGDGAGNDNYYLGSGKDILSFGARGLPGSPPIVDRVSFLQSTDSIIFRDFAYRTIEDLQNDFHQSGQNVIYEYNVLTIVFYNTSLETVLSAAKLWNGPGTSAESLDLDLSSSLKQDVIAEFLDSNPVDEVDYDSALPLEVDASYDALIHFDNGVFA